MPNTPPLINQSHEISPLVFESDTIHVLREDPRLSYRCRLEKDHVVTGFVVLDAEFRGAREFQIANLRVRPVPRDLGNVVVFQNSWAMAWYHIESVYNPTTDLRMDEEEWGHLIQTNWAAKVYADLIIAHFHPEHFTTKNAGFSVDITVPHAEHSAITSSVQLPVRLSDSLGIGCTEILSSPLPLGTIFRHYCMGNNLYQDVANGRGGVYSELVEMNSLHCGDAYPK
jgi:hypothetical protein